MTIRLRYLAILSCLIGALLFSSNGFTGVILAVHGQGTLQDTSSTAPNVKFPLFQASESSQLVRCKNAEFLAPESVHTRARLRANYLCTDNCNICPSYDKDLAPQATNPVCKHDDGTSYINVDRYHRGIDIFGGLGNPVFAVAGGLILDLGANSANEVKIQHANGLVSRYVHLSSVEPNIRPNNYVYPGQKIGSEGKHGTLYSHLHFELYQGGVYADPTPYFELDSPPLLYSVGYSPGQRFECAEPEYLLANSPLPPAGTNLILNGGFNSDFETQHPIWDFRNAENGAISKSIANGKLNIRGKGSFLQTVYYPTPANSVFELSFLLNNTAGPAQYDEQSGGPRSFTVEIYDLNPDGSQQTIATQRFSVPVDKANIERLYSIWIAVADSSDYNSAGSLIVDERKAPLWKPLIVQFYFDDIATNRNWTFDDISFKYLDDSGNIKAEAIATTNLGQSFWACDPVGGNPMCDVPPWHTHFDNIRRLTDRTANCPDGILSGYGDGTFRPGDSLKRGQATKYIVRSMGETRNTPGCDPIDSAGLFFPDVDDSDRFAKYITYLATETGTVYIEGNKIEEPVVKGYADGEFKADNYVTRGQLAKMIALARTNRRPENYRCDYSSAASPAPLFSDVPATNTFIAYISCLKAQGVLKGFSDRTFRPDNEVTRGEAASMIVKGILNENKGDTNRSEVRSSGAIDACLTPSLGAPIDMFTSGYDNDRDCVTVVADANERFGITISEQGWNADLEFSIKNANGQIVFGPHAGAGADGLLFRVWSPEQAGTYTLELRNRNQLAKEGADYRFQLDKVAGTRQYRTDPADDEGICGDSGHIEFEVEPKTSDVVMINLRKCDGTEFTEGGTLFIYVNGAEKWSFPYSGGSSTISKDIQPATQNVFGTNTFQLKIHPSNQSSRAMLTGEVKVWDVYVPLEGDYRYAVYPKGEYSICGGATNTIKMRLQPDSRFFHTVEARIKKCDETAFSSGGNAWIAVKQGSNGEWQRIWGPFRYNAGESSIDMTFDPYKRLGDSSGNSYRAEIFSFCEHGVPNCNPNEAISSGDIAAWPELVTRLIARRNGDIWSEVGIWWEFPSGSPDAQGIFENYVMDGVGPWKLYLDYKPGYSVEIEGDVDGFSLDEDENKYRIWIDTVGRDITAHYILDCFELTNFQGALVGGTVSVTPPPNCGDSLYTHGTQVSQTAAPFSTHTFGAWAGQDVAAARSVEPTIQIIMDGDKLAYPVFNPNCYNLSLEPSPPDAGHVIVSPEPNCSVGQYEVGTPVMVYADATAGFRFQSWTGGITGASNPLTITIYENMTATAQFAVDYPLIAGDVDCDQRATTVDALFILQHGVAMRGASDQCPVEIDSMYLPACDVNGDAACTAVDALFILQCTVQLPNPFCPSGSRQDMTPQPMTQPGQVAQPQQGDDEHPDQDTTIVSIVVDAQGVPLGTVIVDVHYQPEQFDPIACTSDPIRSADLSICNNDFDSDNIGLDSARIALASAAGMSGVIRLADLGFETRQPAADKTTPVVSVVQLTDPRGAPLPFVINGTVIRLQNGTGAPDSQQHRIFVPLVAK